MRRVAYSQCDQFSSSHSRYQCVARQSIVTAPEVALCICYRKRAPCSSNPNTFHPCIPCTREEMLYIKIVPHLFSDSIPMFILLKCVFSEEKKDQCPNVIILYASSIKSRKKRNGNDHSAFIIEVDRQNTKKLN